MKVARFEAWWWGWPDEGGAYYVVSGETLPAPDASRRLAFQNERGEWVYTSVYAAAGMPAADAQSALYWAGVLANDPAYRPVR